MREDAGGLISAALRMPDRPSLSLTAKGQGPIEDFTADIALASAGVDRVTGRVRLRGIAPTEGGGAAGRGIGFDARLEGDVTPVPAGGLSPLLRRRRTVRAVRLAGG
ncbi:hypothetical protein ACFOHS_00700 [Jhaorihella thermophila]